MQEKEAASWCDDRWKRHQTIKENKKNLILKWAYYLTVLKVFAAVASPVFASMSLAFQIKQIVISDNDNLIKFKVQFSNDNTVHQITHKF